MILGMKKLNSQDKKANNWVFMNDADYIISTFGENFNLTAEELKLVTNRGLHINFYEPVPPIVPIIAKPINKVKKSLGRPMKK